MRNWRTRIGGNEGREARGETRDARRETREARGERREARGEKRVCSYGAKRNVLGNPSRVSLGSRVLDKVDGQEYPSHSAHSHE